MSELTPRNICPDFDQWPRDWAGDSDDLKYGRELLAVFEPFCEELIKSGLARTTIRRHMVHLGILGSELIRELDDDEKWRKRPAVDYVIDQTQYGEGPLCRQLDTEEEIRSFDGTCRKLYKFLKDQTAGKKT